MRRLLLIHTVALGLVAAGCASRAGGVRQQESVPVFRGVEDSASKEKRKQQEGQFVAGAAVPVAAEEEQEELPARPAQPLSPRKESSMHKMKRETRKALRDTAKFGRDVVIAVAVGVGFAVGVALIIWGASQSD